MLAKTCLLGVAGNSWEAKIVKKKFKYFICEGEWPQFVVHQKLQLWDILLFLLVDKSKFHVLPYTQKCRINFREKRLAFEELSSSSEDEIGPSRKPEKAKVDDAIDISDSEEERIDTSSDDESKDGDNPSCSRHAKKPKREMMDGNELVNTEPFKRKTGSTAEEDEDEDGSNQEDGRIRKKNRWSVVNFNGEEPSYEMVVKKTHWTFMTIPMNFAKWTGIIDTKKMRLVNSGGKKWRANIVHIGARVRITRGWTDFRTHIGQWW
ncbi:hypothetical protein A4A49_51210 [Nicotiana attenuata]|uniref:TF-B3 domain-containing protein n=1 Tax=Nicotiana attenuata TaxID=49451 RepID=A0A1J6IC31_NICAT|nr:hypothetical protein A4A49_51210 [Nicotiana attenuata]